MGWQVSTVLSPRRRVWTTVARVDKWHGLRPASIWTGARLPGSLQLSPERNLHRRAPDRDRCPTSGSTHFALTTYNLPRLFSEQRRLTGL